MGNVIGINPCILTAGVLLTQDNVISGRLTVVVKAVVIQKPLYHR